MQLQVLQGIIPFLLTPSILLGIKIYKDVHQLNLEIGT